MQKRVKAFYDGCQVRRCHALRTLFPETVGEHSARVAWLASELASSMGLDTLGQLRIVRGALLHDIAEYYTGDMCAPAKKAMGVSLTRLEDEYLDSVGLLRDSPILDPQSVLILKVADTADLLIKSKCELDAGNREYLSVYNHCSKWLKDLVSGDVDLGMILYNLIGDFSERER